MPDLGPSDFTVTIDRQPRRVLWVRHVVRGPGAASEAALRQARTGARTAFAAEPARSVLVVVDQTTLTRGSERAVIQAAGGFLDRLGLDDRVAVVRIPIPAEGRVALTTERPEARETLRLVVGQAAPAAALPAAQVLRDDPDRAMGRADPDQMVDPDRPVAERPTPPVDPATRGLDDPRAEAQGTLPALVGLLHALQAIPGRKVVALFSAGIVGGTSPQLDEAAAVATAAHAVIQAFGVAGGSAGDDLLTPDPAALERLARTTGGSFVALGRNPERAIDRLLLSLSSCYVLGVEAEAADSDARRRALRVETTRARSTVLGPAWFTPTDDPGDLLPPPPPPVEPSSADPGTPPPAAEAARSARGEAAAAERAAREAELSMVMARLVEYVNGYQRQYSALVAEEEYWQRDRTTRRILRSDLLLIRPGVADEQWVSFRDVFEVDGVLVRDREDRLKRLFLEGSPEAHDHLLAIKTESARYNIGQVVRNINVPFFPLLFLNEQNRPCFEFRLAGRQNAAGVDAWRLEFAEQARPTVVRQNEGEDAPARGWFLVDSLTGAVVGTRMELLVGEAKAEWVVRYRRDATLGLWVPSEMTETFQVPTTVTLPGNFGFRSGSVNTQVTTVAEARATYSKFRRFQVKTEAQITLPKKH